MTAISIEEIARDVESCLQRVEAGETLVVTRGQTAVAEIRPVAPTATKLRPFGLCAGEFTVPSDFDAPLPEESIAEFEGR